MASLKEENTTQREALLTKERSRRDVAARCKDQEDRMKFRDEADARRDIVRQKELKDLESGKEEIKSCRSQAQITWDQHEKMSSKLVEVRGELEKAVADLQAET